MVASQSASSVRCVDISAIPEQPEPLIALGHTNGRVTLTTLKQTYDPLGLVGREFGNYFCVHVEGNYLSLETIINDFMHMHAITPLTINSQFNITLKTSHIFKLNNI